MIRANKIFLSLFLTLTFCTAWGQEPDKTAHIRFDLSENYFIPSPPGFIGDSISYYRKVETEKGGFFFTVYTEEFRLVESTAEPEKLKPEDTFDIPFISLEKMMAKWEESDKFLRTDVFAKIYLYEFLTDDRVFEHRVYWVGAYEN